MKPYINMNLYSQTDDTICSIEIYYDNYNNITNQISFRYLVNHIYEIILPIFEKYGQTHTINVGMNGKPLDIGKIKKSYYKSMEDKQ